MSSPSRGFPANHGDFTGDGYWNADVDELHHTVYGPFATDAELTDDLDLTTAPVLAELTTPARNGVYKLGYTDEDKIVPTEPGFYVLVTTFAGDDRVQPYAVVSGGCAGTLLRPTHRHRGAGVGDDAGDTGSVRR